MARLVRWRHGGTCPESTADEPGPRATTQPTRSLPRTDVRAIRSAAEGITCILISSILRYCRIYGRWPSGKLPHRSSRRDRSSVRSGARSTSSAIAGRWCWSAICSAGRSASRSCARARGIAPRVLSSAAARARQARLRRAAARTARAALRSSPSAAARSSRSSPRSARWYLRHGLDDLQVDANRFSATSARSVLESLPFLLREERAAGVDLTFEIRLTGLGGGVWTVRIARRRLHGARGLRRARRRPLHRRRPRLVRASRSASPTPRTCTGRA